MALKWGRVAGEAKSLSVQSLGSALAVLGHEPVSWVEIGSDPGAICDRSFEGRLRSGEIDVAAWDMRRVPVDLDRS